ncbi:MAG: outer membrane lipoprotein carrier protein LolA [Bacteroidales bacterium]|jgi:outer membrane lipoprotein-sorting protein|nr:outer membrane lipoprotein carrier protein LolA [Bacteroidales bacterium]
MKHLFSIALSSILFITSAFGQREMKNGVVIDHSAEKIVKNIAKKLKTDSPVAFNFTLKIQEEGKIVQNEKGAFLSDNDKYRVYTSAFEDYCDGKTLWHYIKAANEVEISNMDGGSSMFNFSNMISTYLNGFRPKLIREEKRPNGTMNILDLTATKINSVIKVRIVATANTNRISEMVIYTSDGKIYTYTISNYQTKQATLPTDFSFPTSKYPKVQSVDLR